VAHENSAVALLLHHCACVLGSVGVDDLI